MGLWERLLLLEFKIESLFREVGELKKYVTWLEQQLRELQKQQG